VAEIAEIRRIIREKQTAPADRQKALRAKLRRLGFYISDYSDEPGLVESDVDDLIRRGTIFPHRVAEVAEADPRAS
jgi:hypothetical protein